MRVIVDPIELMTTAVTMGAVAVELADVGSSLRSCVGCAMPPDIRNMVDRLVATTDGVLDASAGVLRIEAGDLAQRALIATNDSLAAASLAITPTNHFGGITAGQPVIAGAGMIGGNSWSDSIHAPTPVLGAMVGGTPGWRASVHSASPGFGAGMIGGPTAGRDNPQLRAEAATADAARRLRGALATASPNSGNAGSALIAMQQNSRAYETIYQSNKRMAAWALGNSVPTDSFGTYKPFNEWNNGPHGGFR